MITEFQAEYRHSHADQWKRSEKTHLTYESARDDANRLAIIHNVGSPENVRVVKREVTETVL